MVRGPPGDRSVFLGGPRSHVDKNDSPYVTVKMKFIDTTLPLEIVNSYRFEQIFQILLISFGMLLEELFFV